MGPDRNLDHLYAPFRSIVVGHVLLEMQSYADKHMPKGVKIVLVEGYRSLAYQQHLYALGRTLPGKIVTMKDGNPPSAHQLSLAADFLFVLGDHVYSARGADYSYLGHVGRSHGLEYGGDWNGFHDIDHLQWRSADRKTYEDAKAWQRAVGLA